MREVPTGHVTNGNPLATYLMDQLLTYYVHIMQVEISGHYISKLLFYSEEVMWLRIFFAAPEPGFFKMWRQNWNRNLEKE